MFFVLLPLGVTNALLLWFLLGRAEDNLPRVKVPATSIFATAISIFLGLSVLSDSLGLVLYPVLFFSVLWFCLKSDSFEWGQIFLFDCKPWIRVLLISLTTGLLLIPVGAGLMLVSNFVFEQFGIPARPQSSVLRLAQSQGWEFVRLLLLGILVAPVVEETFFRGYLLPALRARMGSGISNFLQAAVFSTIHFHLQSFVALFFLGVVLAWQYNKTRNLIAPVVTHSLFNLINILMLIYLTKN